MLECKIKRICYIYELNVVTHFQLYFVNLTSHMYVHKSEMRAL